jgi:hypothetical protein
VCVCVCVCARLSHSILTLVYVDGPAFIAFAIAAFFHQIFMLLGQHLIRKPFVQPLEEYSFRWRIACFLANQVVFAIAVFVFVRHNWYCEPGGMCVVSHRCGSYLFARSLAR